MTTVTGTVTRTNSREFNGRKGPFTMYSFQTDQDDDWIGCGTKQPPFNEGDNITFAWEFNNKGYKTLVDGSVVKLQQAAAPSAGKPAGGRVSRDDYWRNKEARDIEIVEPRITLSASRTAAIQVIGLALQHDAIVFGNAAKGAKLGIILDAIDEVTGRYYQQSMGDIIEDMADAAEADDPTPPEDWE